jgi:hypothetical protein
MPKRPPAEVAGGSHEGCLLTCKPRRRSISHCDLHQVGSHCWTELGICAYGGTQGTLPTPKGHYAPRSLFVVQFVEIQ